MKNIILLLCFICIASCGPFRPINIQSSTIVVAKDGSGNYKTVQAAVNSLPDNSKSYTEILIKPGTYDEHITINAKKTFVKIVGGGSKPEDTVLSFDITTSTPNTSYAGSGAFVAENNDFYVQNIMFYNTHGAGTQAIAASFLGERQEFKDCVFKGYQDTLFMESGLQYYTNCTILGAVDFIYGGSTAVFDECIVHSVAGGALTAPKTPQTQQYGITFLHCTLSADSSVKSGSTYLGRTWGPYAKADFLNCNEGSHIAPVGWSNMGNPSYQPTVRLAEYENSGSGFQPKARVSWSSQLSSSQAAEYTVKNILGGWTPVSLSEKYFS